jgi:putative DNA primase/helicase
MATDYSALDAVAISRGPAKVVQRAIDALPPERDEPPLDGYDDPSDAVPRARAFAEVRIDDLSTWQPEHPGWWWNGYMPAREVTGLSAHGGTGKSTVAAILGAHIALGLPYLGQQTRQGRVLYFSAEDPANVLRFRIAKIARQYEMDCEALAQNLHVLDATEGHPVLWADGRTAGSGHAGLTATYRELKRYIEAHQIDVLLIDNASDVFAGDEINRAAVRAFMQSLAALVRPQGGAALLLLHVDKASARGVSMGADNYSGSTAWHNSARSRLFLKRQGDGLELLHEKCNHGPLMPSLALEWPEGGLPQVERQPQPFVAAIQARNDTKAVLRLIAEFGGADGVATSRNSPLNAARKLSGRKGYPSLKPAEVFNLLDDAERAGYLARVTLVTEDRKRRERWSVTDTGCRFAEIAPSAPSAPTHDPEGLGAVGAGGAPSAPTPGAGGVGVCAGAELGAPRSSS